MNEERSGANTSPMFKLVHDLKTPLMVIFCSTELLQLQNRDAEINEHIERIALASEQLRELIHKAERIEVENGS